MWNHNAVVTPSNPSASVLTASEFQALFHEAHVPGDAGLQAFGLSQTKVSSQPQVVSWVGSNLILSALRPDELASLMPHLERVTLASGQVIGQPGHALQHVYFPINSSVSWVSHTADGESAELALVGRDGLIGAPLVLGGLAMQHTVQVQCGGQALRIGADEFLRLLGLHPRLHKLALLFVQWQMAQMAQSIVCSRHHAVSERLSHWLLSNAQGANTRELHVTHETISHMLGVRRESVTQAAGRFQAAGWIANSRGKIILKDPEGLRSMACECQSRSRAESKNYVQQLAQLASAPNGHGLDKPTWTSWAALPGQTAAALQAEGGETAAVWPPNGLSHEEDLPSQPEGDFQKYVDAYDFAPVGFVTLNAQGQILQTNLAGAILLDIQRSQCQHHVFADFLEVESQTPFASFHQEVLGGQCRRHCVVQLTPTAHRSAVRVRIDATADEWGVENRMVLIDVSDPAPQEVPQRGAWIS